MAKKGTQQDYWDEVAAPRWDAYGSPLIPNAQEINFQRQLLVSGGTTLVLGATRELCLMARDISSKVIAVDFSTGVIEKLRCEGVEYILQDWFEYFKETAVQFDNIITDGGLLCIEFPKLWQQLAEDIHSHLLPGGTFAARLYLSQPESPADAVDNPNLGQFVKQDARREDHWMITPKHEDYTNYDVQYAKPPEKELHQIFSRRTGFELCGKIIPEYEGGEHFPTEAWQRIEI